MQAQGEDQEATGWRPSGCGRSTEDQEADHAEESDHDELEHSASFERVMSIVSFGDADVETTSLECKNGHVLRPFVTGGGRCDHCDTWKLKGEGVLACRECNWWLCETCVCERHEGIWCDSCGMTPLCGPRYKKQLVDETYDVCQRCYNNLDEDAQAELVQIDANGVVIGTAPEVHDSDSTITCTLRDDEITEVFSTDTEAAMSVGPPSGPPGGPPVYTIFSTCSRPTDNKPTKQDASAARREQSSSALRDEQLQKISQLHKLLF